MEVSLVLKRPLPAPSLLPPARFLPPAPQDLVICFLLKVGETSGSIPPFLQDVDSTKALAEKSSENGPSLRDGSDKAVSSSLLTALESWCGYRRMGPLSLREAKQFTEGHTARERQTP